MLEGTLSVYAFILIFPLAVLGGLIFLIRNYIRSTEYCDVDARFDGKTIVVTGMHFLFVCYFIKMYQEKYCEYTSNVLNCNDGN